MFRRTVKYTFDPPPALQLGRAAHGRRAATKTSRVCFPEGDLALQLPGTLCVHAERKSLGKLETPASVAGIARELLKSFEPIQQEYMIVLCLSARLEVTAWYVAAAGPAGHVALTSSLLLRGVVASLSPACVLVHNHPSGDPQPSPEDVALTARMVQAASLLGIQLQDHIIIGARDYYSMRERGDVDFSWRGGYA